MRGAPVLCAVVLFLPQPAPALDLDFPGGAELVASAPPVAGLHPIATAPWREGGPPTDPAEGLVQQSTWRVTGDGLTSLSLLTALRDQIVAQGFAIGFTCFADGCGGFDFRHALPLGEPPDMYVDLGDFHYLAATADGPDGPQELALTVSMGGDVGFVHLALVQPVTEAPAPVIQSSRAPVVVIAETPPPIVPEGLNGDGLIARLLEMGSAPLDDLQFQTGASDLSGESYASLSALAAFLAEDPDRAIVLVGHTDASGSLAGNVALSEARASAVRRFLTAELGVNPQQVEAQGIGFLAPRASNTTPEGREANRRVEVVLATPG